MKFLLLSVDVIITSDHGMARVYPDNQTIYLEDYVDLDKFDIIDYSPAASLRPTGKSQKTVEKRTLKLFNQLSGKHPNMTVYLKPGSIPSSEIKSMNTTGENGLTPKRLHYSANPRIMNIVISADIGWIITDSRTNTYRSNIGVHGYDNKYREMHQLFLATGPSFKAGEEIFETFSSVNVYPLICSILGLSPAPNNGSLANVANLLSNNSIPPEKIYEIEESSPLESSTNKGAIVTENSGGTVTAGIIGFLVGASLMIVIFIVFYKKGKLKIAPSTNYSNLDEMKINVIGETELY